MPSTGSCLAWTRCRRIHTARPESVVEDTNAAILCGATHRPVDGRDYPRLQTELSSGKRIRRFGKGRIGARRGRTGTSERPAELDAELLARPVTPRRVTVVRIDPLERVGEIRRPPRPQGL